MTGSGAGGAGIGTLWCERAWLPGGVAERVLVAHDGAGLITSVRAGAEPQAGAERLAGLVFPGFANVHSHAFHRALRGRTHGDAGTFWTWRTAMYRLAERLDPERYHRLARLVYAEMALAGYTLVGEFHYLHHPPGGGRYAEPNAMGQALLDAAREAGLRITLLDSCYLRGGLAEAGYLPLRGVQSRFGDDDVADWAKRVSGLADRPDARVGTALHSVRAVPPDAMREFAAAVNARPVHVHLSEQLAENHACEAFHGRSPTELLADIGVLGPGVTAVHATHLTATDIALLGSAGATCCLCPSTEADLADGIGPGPQLTDAGCRISLGSDQHAVTDPFVEARALEYGARLRGGRRGRFTPSELVRCATEHGYGALGWPEGGRIEAGAPCDLVAVRTDTTRTAGALPEQITLAAFAADVHTVLVGGRVVARDGRHTALGQVGPALAAEIAGLWSQPS
jgi:formiminoglutamate deiminase